MNKASVVHTAAFVVGATSAGIFVFYAIKNHPSVRQIEADLQLDLAAIRKAGAVVREKISTEDPKPLHVRLEQLENEVAFQKIVIREQ